MIAGINNKREIQMIHVLQLQKARDNQIAALAKLIPFENVVAELQREICKRNACSYPFIEIYRYSFSIKDFRFWNSDGSFNIPAYWFDTIVTKLLNNGFNINIIENPYNYALVTWGDNAEVFQYIFSKRILCSLQ